MSDSPKAARQRFFCAIRPARDCRACTSKHLPGNGLFKFIKFLFDFEEKMSETETAIIDIDSADITRLAWNYEEEVSFVRHDGEWQYEADEKMAVYQ